MSILLLSNYAPYTTSVLLKRGFEELGHKVFATSPEGPPDWIRCDPRSDVRDLINRLPERPEFVLMVEASTGTVFFPQGLLDCPVPTIFWAIDSHFNYTWHKAWCGMFDLTLLAQKDYLKRASAQMQSVVEWLPLAADYSWHALPAESNSTRTRDIVFVGHVGADRKDLFEQIQASIPTFEVFSGVYGKNVGELYAQARIGFNTCVNRDLNMRFFEVLASGALLVTEDIEAGMRDLFVEGKHFVCHRRHDAAAILKHWLERDSERESIAAAGREQCLSKNLYRHRAQTIIDLVQRHIANISRRRERKKRSARLYLNLAAALETRPFNLPRDAASWAAKGLAQSDRWQALGPLVKYFIRRLRTVVTP